MKTVGIIAEYNPLHSGHVRHIGQTRAAVGEDCRILCFMSGNWVQRGDAAIADKWTRAEMALWCGADLVLELPLPWAISSAKRFAEGAVPAMSAPGGGGARQGRGPFFAALEKRRSFCAFRIISSRSSICMPSGRALLPSER